MRCERVTSWSKTWGPSTTQRTAVRGRSMDAGEVTLSDRTAIRARAFAAGALTPRREVHASSKTIDPKPRTLTCMM